MMVLSSAQIRSWDEYTITNEPIASIELMERAASTCIDWLFANNFYGKSFQIFCGKGNNGGDGLAMARLLCLREQFVSVYILEFGNKGTADFQTNLEKLHQYPVDIKFIQQDHPFPEIEEGSIIIDALFGTGLNRPATGFSAEIIRWINSLKANVISIDLPSGLNADDVSGEDVIHAKHTLTFQAYKPGLLVSQNANFIGEVHVLDIGLHPQFEKEIRAEYRMTTHSLIRSIFKKRKRFTHKGNFGHALLIVGSFGKMGAAVLAAKACIRSGVGLLTCHIPRIGYDVLQTTVPEAMVSADINANMLTTFHEDISVYNAIGIGPGIGGSSETADFLKKILVEKNLKLVLDADAINLVAKNNYHKKIPAQAILTPHPKEFDRLFGACASDFERIRKAIENANSLNVVIVLKSHHTFITDGTQHFFNKTGNSGLAKGGSGDVLTGMITSFLAQGYTPFESAKLGVFMHGLAADITREFQTEETMTPSDVILVLGNAFRRMLA